MISATCFQMFQPPKESSGGVGGVSVAPWEGGHRNKCGGMLATAASGWRGHCVCPLHGCSESFPSQSRVRKRGLMAASC